MILSIINDIHEILEGPLYFFFAVLAFVIGISSIVIKENAEASATQMANIPQLYVSKSVAFIDGNTVGHYRYLAKIDSSYNRFFKEIPALIPQVTVYKGKKLFLSVTDLQKVINKESTKIPVDTIVSYEAMSNNSKITSNVPFSCNNCQIKTVKTVTYTEIPTYPILKNDTIILVN